QIVGVLAPGSRFVKVFDTGLRRDAVASVPGDSVLVDKTERCHAEIGFFGEAGGTGLRRLDKSECGRMCAEKDLYRRRRRLGLTARGGGTQEFEELLTGSSGEAVCRMADDVGVNVIGQMEADSQTARICIGIVVGNDREPRGVG